MSIRQPLPPPSTVVLSVATVLLPTSVIWVTDVFGLFCLLSDRSVGYLVSRLDNASFQIADSVIAKNWLVLPHCDIH